MSDTYTVYADRESGGYYTWYYSYDGEKQVKRCLTKQDVSNFAKKSLYGLKYKIVYLTKN